MFLNKSNTQSIKALLVGINYRGTKNELGGCINDALAMRQTIRTEYPNAQITLLTDDTPIKPTRDNILANLSSLVADAKTGDTLLFHYSGHGSQVPDLEGDEEDGYDETICPIDFMTPRIVTANDGRMLRLDSQIIDDEIHAIITRTPKGVRFLMVSDSCHSGTIGDLKNDFAHYHGGAVWQEATAISNSNSTLSSHDVVSSSIDANQEITPETVTCEACWVYAKHFKEIWLTPLDASLHKEIGRKCTAKIEDSNVPVQLSGNPDKILKFSTTFNKQSNGKYAVTCSELGVSELNFTALRIITAQSKSIAHNKTRYYYDNVAKKHHHFHPVTNAKRSLSVRSLDSEHNGELRIIAGCEENETSADTGRNGACTNAVLETIHACGNLDIFFSKIFSHVVADIRAIETYINSVLARFGFTQHSVISWDHARDRSYIIDCDRVGNRNVYGLSLETGPSYKGSVNTPKF